MFRFCRILYEISRVIKTYGVLPFGIKLQNLVRSENLLFKLEVYWHITEKNYKFIFVVYYLKVQTSFLNLNQPPI